jgi:hypothetical protein
MAQNQKRKRSERSGFVGYVLAADFTVEFATQTMVEAAAERSALEVLAVQGG